MDNNTVKAAYEEHGPYKFDNKIKENPNRTLKGPISMEDNAIYYGYIDLETNERDGYGVMIWPDGSRYDGTWEHNLANGNGRLIHADGDIYIGEWKNDKTEGLGKYIHSDGAVYEGNWQTDKQEGYGEESWPDGSKYQGMYKGGKNTLLAHFGYWKQTGAGTTCISMSSVKNGPWLL